ncbi:MFS transporter [Hydromonas duriensis]|uniref:Multidrug efflux pump Tap n=1 Tax=Hydromonas duriensis TaxID=1527608 RepID=A0A4R6Y6V0_9BURK|nr:MFS transporter [Hydromonas duriensis]TDR28838.1 putative MFS family arabinose efflux permease [Hydromonas duriensis]
MGSILRENGHEWGALSREKPQAQNPIARKKAVYNPLSIFQQHTHIMPPKSHFVTKPFIALLTYRLSVVLCYQIVAVVVGWQVYDFTHDKLALGLIGLSEVIPYFASALFAGYAVDHYSRRGLGILACALLLSMAIGLTVFSSGMTEFVAHWGVWPIYAAIALSGLARAFLSPVYNTLLVQLVERENYAKAAGIGSAVFQFAQILGPTIGGLLVAFGSPTSAYAITALCALTGMLALMRLKRHVTSNPKPPQSGDIKAIFTSIQQGLQFVFKNEVLLSALALDMFAVLFGGAMALLPAFVNDVLHQGPETLGLLRAAPAVGAIAMGIYLTRNPINRHAGKILLSCVAAFGMCMIVFALSKTLWLSALALALSGMFDSVSVVLRSTILQLTTPDDMRGRVSAINGLFIGSSNEIGAFESGVTAAWLGLVPSVVAGALVTLGIVAVTAKIAPKLRRLHIQDLL